MIGSRSVFLAACVTALSGRFSLIAAANTSTTQETEIHAAGMMQRTEYVLFFGSFTSVGTMPPGSILVAGRFSWMRLSYAESTGEREGTRC